MWGTYRPVVLRMKIEREDERERCQTCGGWLVSWQDDPGLDPVCKCVSRDLDEIDKILEEDDGNAA